MKYTTFARDKQTKERYFVTYDYPTKRQFIYDCRANGLEVNEDRVLTADQYEWLMDNTNGTELDFQVMRRFKLGVPTSYTEFCNMKDKVMGVDR